MISQNSEFGLDHRSGLLSAVSRDTVRGSAVEPDQALGAVPLMVWATVGMDHIGEYADRFCGANGSRIELKLAAGTPRPKGAVGECPRSAPA